jgi:transposase
VAKWRNRFAVMRLQGLLDNPRPGRPRLITDEKVEAVITKTPEERPTDATHWSTRSMAKAMGVSRTAISRIWRAFGLKPNREETFKLSTDPAAFPILAEHPRPSQPRLHPPRHDISVRRPRGSHRAQARQVAFLPRRASDAQPAWASSVRSRAVVDQRPGATASRRAGSEASPKCSTAWSWTSSSSYRRSRWPRVIPLLTTALVTCSRRAGSEASPNRSTASPREID